jgi:hypothetical protein
MKSLRTFFVNILRYFRKSREQTIAKDIPGEAYVPFEHIQRSPGWLGKTVVFTKHHENKKRKITDEEILNAFTNNDPTKP